VSCLFLSLFSHVFTNSVAVGMSEENEHPGKKQRPHLRKSKQTGTALMADDKKHQVREINEQAFIEEVYRFEKP
jgi:hypothetical protein